MKIIAITQARTGSSRLPNKVLKTIDGESLLEIQINRIKTSKRITDIIVATTVKIEDEVIQKEAQRLGVHSYRGSEDDVLDRFYQAVKLIKPEYVVRLTSDCPLLDGHLIDKVIELALMEKVDYCSNTLDETFPDGQDIEVFTFEALEKAWLDAKLKSEREHVTPFIKNNSTFHKKELFKATNFYSEYAEYKDVRMTVDEQDDFEVISKMIEKFGKEESWNVYAKYYVENESVGGLNNCIVRNEGYIKSIKEDLEKLETMRTGQKLYERAKQIIPGGTMLLSKRPEMFLPENWPAYYSKSKGCEVWDLDNRKYIDVSIMGIGTNIMGYGHQEVDAAVFDVVKNGNMSTLNCPEEVYLAEKLIDMNPWADMVRFARSGGEANAIAIRIARAATGKDKVAICGYHGWHDWYLSTNLGNDEGLAQHLLPGLDPCGVPQNLKGSTLPFLYNDYEELENLVRKHNVGVIKMEVQRNEPPKNDFLKKVRKLADDHNIVLIFDECTSGFRETYGPLFKKYDVEPDMTIFGKTIANGYALTAVVGKRAVMEAAQKTFISSTFWTERIGSAAALKTLQVMERDKPWEYITEMGQYVTGKWNELAEKQNLNINTFGIPALTGFSFESVDALKYKTLITQEMLKRGYLASTLLYPCTAHTKDIIDTYMTNLEELFYVISQCELKNKNINDLLEGPVCHGGFKRLN